MAHAHSVGVIIDGNRRWAAERGLSSYAGHAEGVRRVRDTVRWAAERGHVDHIFFYTLSTENWTRAPREVEHLLLLIELFFRTHAEELAQEDVRIRVTGQRERFSPKIRRMFDSIEERTRENTGVTAWFGLSYGGRAEILDAAYRLGTEKLIPTEESLKKLMWTAELPDPDIILRTGGEQRLSNFLTWGSVYSELFFSKTLWPAFTKDEFNAILDAYEVRERRKGK